MSTFTMLKGLVIIKELLHNKVRLVCTREYKLIDCMISNGMEEKQDDKQTGERLSNHD